MAGPWAGGGCCCPREVGRAGRRSRTPQLISLLRRHFSGLPVGLSVPSSHHLLKTPPQLCEWFSFYSLIKRAPVPWSFQPGGQRKLPAAAGQCPGGAGLLPPALPAAAGSSSLPSPAAAPWARGCCQQREGDGQPPTHTASPLRTGRGVLATGRCACGSPAPPVLPDSRVHRLCWHWPCWPRVFTAAECLRLHPRRSAVRVDVRVQNRSPRWQWTQAPSGPVKFCRSENCCLFKSRIWALVGPPVAVLLSLPFCSLGRKGFYPFYGI